jgi:hypothetical protein
MAELLIRNRRIQTLRECATMAMEQNQWRDMN